MIWQLARRLIGGVTLFFALYAFASLPLGKKTGLEHARAILSTPEAAEAGAELKGAFFRVWNQLVAATAAESNPRAQAGLGPARPSEARPALAAIESSLPPFAPLAAELNACTLESTALSDRGDVRTSPAPDSPSR